jgi:hypothetical protein
MKNKDRIERLEARLDRLATLHGGALEVQDAFDMALQHRVSELEDRLAAEQNYSAFLATDLKNLTARFNQLERDVCRVTDSHRDDIVSLKEGLLMTGGYLSACTVKLGEDVDALARGLVRVGNIQRVLLIAPSFGEWVRGVFARLRGQL